MKPVEAPMETVYGNNKPSHWVSKSFKPVHINDLIDMDDSDSDKPSCDQCFKEFVGNHFIIVTTHQYTAKKFCDTTCKVKYDRHALRELQEWWD